MMVVGSEPFLRCSLAFAFRVMLNAYWEPPVFELPAAGEGRSWRRWFDTTLSLSHEIVPWPEAPPVPGDSYRVGPRSAVCLISLAPDESG
jgi:glycogen operon protein